MLKHASSLLNCMHKWAKSKKYFLKQQLQEWNWQRIIKKKKKAARVELATNIITKICDRSVSVLVCSHSQQGEQI